MIESGAGRRCPHCGALVSEDADWCGQCLGSLVEAPAPAATRVVAEAKAVVAEATPLGAEPGAGNGASAPIGEGVGGAFWPCTACGHRNRIESDACEACGTSFAQVMRDVRADATNFDPKAALRASLLFPGLGHWKLGRALDAIARGSLFALTLATTILLVVSRSGKSLGPAVPIGLLYGGSALLIYLVSALDAHRIASGVSPITSPRMLMWGVVILVVLSAMIAVFAVLSASRPG